MTFSVRRLRTRIPPSTSRTALVCTTSLLVSLVLALGGLPAGADGAQVEVARRDAEAVAADVAAARAHLATVEDEAASVAARIEVTEARLEELRDVVQDQAVERFVRGGHDTSGATHLLLQGEDITAAAKADALARTVTAGTDEALDEYRAVSEELASSRRHLVEVRGMASAALEELDRRAAAATAELEHQVALEAERLEAERLAAERLEAERSASEQRASEQRASEQPGTEQPVTEGAGSEDVPAVAGSGGAQPGGGDAAAATGSGGTGFLCPVAGPRAFSNDWGQARSGGRRHQGTDMLSPRGTPVVASVSGTVEGHRSSLGGTSYTLKGDDGTTYYGTHLDSLSGVSGRVARGTVLGRVGNSGNARGGPTHLHFEIRPGGAPVNPYPTLAAHC